MKDFIFWADPSSSKLTQRGQTAKCLMALLSSPESFKQFIDPTAASQFSLESTVAKVKPPTEKLGNTAFSAAPTVRRAIIATKPLAFERRFLAIESNPKPLPTFKVKVFSQYVRKRRPKPAGDPVCPQSQL